jgi:hypothetical protein
MGNDMGDETIAQPKHFASIDFGFVPELNRERAAGPPQKHRSLGIIGRWRSRW